MAVEHTYPKESISALDKAKHCKADDGKVAVRVCLHNDFDGSIPNVNNPQLVCTTPITDQVDMANAGDEYSKTLPTNTKKFLMNSRLISDVKISFTAGGTTSGDYFTQPEGYSEDSLNLTGKTIYFNTDCDDNVMEFLIWT